MRTPANCTKQFMNDLVGTINLFFSRISKGHIQFQLSEHYTIPKKNDYPAKAKMIKKDSKIKIEDNAQKAKQLKKALKKYREAMNSDQKFVQETKDLSEKQRNQKIKKMWKNMSEDQRTKWSIIDRKKARIKLTTKGDVKNGIKLNKKVQTQ